MPGLRLSGQRIRGSDTGLHRKYKPWPGESQKNMSTSTSVCSRALLHPSFGHFRTDGNPVGAGIRHGIRADEEHCMCADAGNAWPGKLSDDRSVVGPSIVTDHCDGPWRYSIVAAIASVTDSASCVTHTMPASRRFTVVPSRCP